MGNPLSTYVAMSYCWGRQVSSTLEEASLKALRRIGGIPVEG